MAIEQLEEFHSAPGTGGPWPSIHGGPQRPGPSSDHRQGTVQSTTLPILVPTYAHPSFTYLLTPPSKQVPHSGLAISLHGERLPQALEVGSGPFGKEFWGPGCPDQGGWYGSRRHMPWVDRSPALRQRYSQTKELGFLEHGLRLPRSQGGTDEL